MKSLKGVSPVILLIVILTVVSTLFLGIFYWSGFISFQGQIFETQERLQIVSASCFELNGSKVLKVTVKNVGSVDVKVEYAVLDGKVAQYYAKYYDSSNTFGSPTDQYLIIPCDLLVDLYFSYVPRQDLTAWIRLHTVAGNDFQRAVPITIES